MAYYFKIEIPRHTDGRIATYSEGWFGTMDKCPKNVTVHLFNDKDGYLIASADDSFIPPEVEVMAEVDALAELSEIANLTGAALDKIYLGSKVEERWQAQKDKIMAEDAEVLAQVEEDAKLTSLLDGLVIDGR